LLRAVPGAEAARLAVEEAARLQAVENPEANHLEDLGLLLVGGGIELVVGGRDERGR
jgi:hypothetical protein